MAEIRTYPFDETFDGDEALLGETSDGTRRIPLSIVNDMIREYITGNVFINVDGTLDANSGNAVSNGAVTTVIEALPGHVLSEVERKYATKEEIYDTVTGEILSEYVTGVEMRSYISQTEEEIKSSVSRNYATKEYVTDAVSGVVTESLVTRHELESAIEQTAESINLHVSDNFITRGQLDDALAGYTPDTPDDERFVTLEQHKADLALIPGMIQAEVSGTYATKDYVDDAIEAIDFSEIDTSDFVRLDQYTTLVTQLENKIEMSAVEEHLQQGGYAKKSDITDTVDGAIDALDIEKYALKAEMQANFKVATDQISATVKQIDGRYDTELGESVNIIDGICGYFVEGGTSCFEPYINKSGAAQGAVDIFDGYARVTALAAGGCAVKFDFKEGKFNKGISYTATAKIRCSKPLASFAVHFGSDGFYILATFTLNETTDWQMVTKTFVWNRTVDISTFRFAFFNDQIGGINEYVDIEWIQIEEGTEYTSFDKRVGGYTDKFYEAYTKIEQNADEIKSVAKRTGNLSEDLFGKRSNLIEGGFGPFDTKPDNDIIVYNPSATTITETSDGLKVSIASEFSTPPNPGFAFKIPVNALQEGVTYVISVNIHSVGDEYHPTWGRGNGTTIYSNNWSDSDYRTWYKNSNNENIDYRRFVYQPSKWTGYEVDGYYHLGFYCGSAKGRSWYLKWVQFEEGDFPSEFSADGMSAGRLKNMETTITQDASKIALDATKLWVDGQDFMTEHELTSNFTVTPEAITQLVKNVTYEKGAIDYMIDAATGVDMSGYMTRTETEAAIETTAGRVAISAAERYIAENVDLDQYITLEELTSDFIVTPDAIKAEVSKSFYSKDDVDDKIAAATGTDLSGYYTKTEVDSAIDQKADEINLTVQRTDMLVRGGNPNNLIPIDYGGYEEFGPTCFISVPKNNSSLPAISTHDGYTRLERKGSVSTSLYSGAGFVIPGKGISFVDKYTLSMKVRSSYATTIRICCGYESDYSKYIELGTISITAGDWQVKSLTTNIKLSKVYPTLMIYVASTTFTATGRYIDIEWVQFEKGDIPTDYVSEDASSIGKRLYHAESSIKQNYDSIQLKVDVNGVVSAINMSDEEVAINANKINLNGVVTANEAFRILEDGSMNATGAVLYDPQDHVYIKMDDGLLVTYKSQYVPVDTDEKDLRLARFSGIIDKKSDGSFNMGRTDIYGGKIILSRNSSLGAKLYGSTGGTVNVDKNLNVINNCSVNGTLSSKTGSVAAGSDRRLKNSIFPLDDSDAERFIYALNPVEYKYNEGTSNRKHHGFIADELRTAMGNQDWGVYLDDRDGSYCRIRYEEIIADLVAVVKKQGAEIEALKKAVNNGTH